MLFPISHCFGGVFIILYYTIAVQWFTRLIKVHYSRLKMLNLTLLAERRIHGDLIESFKLFSVLVECGQQFLTSVDQVWMRFCNFVSLKKICFSMNIVSKIKCNITSSQSRNILEAFLPERVMPYWNVQSLDVKNSYSVNNLNINLDYVKKNHIILKWFCCDHHGKCLMKWWSRIEGYNHFENKSYHDDYLWLHPYLAKKMFINLN